MHADECILSQSEMPSIGNPHEREQLIYFCLWPAAYQLLAVLAISMLSFGHDCHVNSVSKHIIMATKKASQWVDLIQFITGLISRDLTVILDNVLSSASNIVKAINKHYSIEEQAEILFHDSNKGPTVKRQWNFMPSILLFKLNNPSS